MEQTNLLNNLIILDPLRVIDYRYRNRYRQISTNETVQDHLLKGSTNGKDHFSATYKFTSPKNFGNLNYNVY